MAAAPSPLDDPINLNANDFGHCLTALASTTWYERT